MTQEEKAKRYDDALETARKINSGEGVPAPPDWTTYEVIFPELKESKDEKIKRILHSISSKMSFHLRDIFTEEEFQCFDAWYFAWLEKQGEQKEYTFRSLPRLLDMIEPTSKAKAYCQKLIDTLVKEGYSTDAKIVGECLKIMNGDNVPMAIMDEKQGKPKWTKEDSLMVDSIIDTMKWLEGKGATNMKIDWLESIKKRMEE